MTARNSAGWNATRMVKAPAATNGKPAFRNDRKQNAAISANTPAATSAGAGVAAGASHATSVAARNGHVG